MPIRYGGFEVPVQNASDIIVGGAAYFVSGDINTMTPETFSGIVIDPDGKIADYLPGDPGINNGITGWQSGTKIFQLDTSGLFFLNLIDDSSPGILVGNAPTVTGFAIKTSGFFMLKGAGQLSAQILQDNVLWQGDYRDTGDQFIGNYQGGAGIFFDEDGGDGGTGLLDIKGDINMANWYLQPPDDYLIWSFTFDENGGNRVLDSSRSGYNAEFYGIATTYHPSWAGGVVGSCLYFNRDGSNNGDLINFAIDKNPTSLNFTSQNFTISFWVYLLEANIGYIFRCGTANSNGWSITVGTTSLSFNTYNGSANTHAVNPGMSTGTFYHCSFVRNGSSWTWYVGGVSKGTGSYTNATTISSYSGTCLIGGYATVHAQNFKGYIDQLRVYSMALNERSVKSHYLYPAGSGGGRIVAGAIVVGDVPTVTGTLLDSLGLRTYVTSGADLFQLHAYSISATSIPWQRNTNSMVYPEDINFALTVGDYVIGGYNYRFVLGGDYAGGVRWSQVYRTLTVRGAAVIRGYSYEQEVLAGILPAGYEFEVIGDLAVTGNIDIYSGGDINFYNASLQLIGSILTDPSMAVNSVVVTCSASFGAGAYLYASNGEAAIRGLITSAIYGSGGSFTAGMYGGAINLTVSSTGVSCGTGLSCTLNNIYLGADGSRFVLHLPTLGVSYPAFIAPT